MIRPPGWDGVAFTDRSDGDLRGDPQARSEVSRSLGVSDDWAVVRQVHGSRVVRVDGPGDAGESDALWTSSRGLPVAVFTADCYGVVLLAADAVGVAHAGWRGAFSGVVESLREEMTSAGVSPVRAAVGPGIGPCCFEVGDDVAGAFGGRHVGETTWGTTSVDLPGVLADGLADLEVWASGGCTLHEEGWFSHRGDGTTRRMAAVGWLP